MVLSLLFAVLRAEKLVGGAKGALVHVLSKSDGG